MGRLVPVSRLPSRAGGYVMGQRLAKHYMDDGVRLYHVQHRQLAVDKWRHALERLKNSEDRFITMGYLAQAYCEVGNFHEMLTFAMHQIDLANQCADSYMKAEAYLNLARASERLSEFHKAISYARHSIQHQSMDPRTPGYAYLCMAQAYLGFSQFQLALEHYELSMQVASNTSDKLLELQICVGLGSLFTQLRDLAKAVIFLQNALALLKTISLGDVQAKYRSLILFHLSVALRKNGSLVDSRSAAEEALRLATDSGHQPIQARCLLSLGDVHQELGEKEAALMHYDSAYSQMREMDDKLGQVAVLTSLAKAAGEAHRTDSRQCECQALQLNKKCLELAKQIGCKLAMLKCHSRLQDLYAQLSDDESEDIAKKAVTALTQELEMYCNFCGQRFGHRDESLQALPCSHLFHQRCLHNSLGQRANKDCPKCAHMQRAGMTPRKSQSRTGGGMPSHHQPSTSLMPDCNTQSAAAAAAQPASSSSRRTSVSTVTSVAAMPDVFAMHADPSGKQHPSGSDHNPYQHQNTTSNTIMMTMSNRAGSATPTSQQNRHNPDVSQHHSFLSPTHPTRESTSQSQQHSPQSPAQSVDALLQQLVKHQSGGQPTTTAASGGSPTKKITPAHLHNVANV